MALLGFFDMIAQTDAIATVMAQQAEVERWTMSVVEKINVCRTANEDLRGQIKFVKRQQREAEGELWTLEEENSRLYEGCPDWEERLDSEARLEWAARPMPDGVTRVAALNTMREDIELALSRQEVQQLQDLRADRPQRAMATSDAASLARMGGLSHAHHAAAHEGPVADALAQLAASSRLLVEANEALENETEKSMTLVRKLVWLSHKLANVQYNITYFTDQNEQIEIVESDDDDHIDTRYYY